MRFLVVLCSAMLLLACSSPAEKMEKAMSEGELSKAEELLTEMSRKQKYDYASRLIDEYLAVGNVDKAIYVFNHITPHCSMAEIKFSSLYSTASYTQENAKKIYKALLAEERYDECWSFHPLSYETETYPGNAHDYFSYMCDVVEHMCVNGQTDKARKFIAHKSLWFMNNVDNHQWGHKYPDYTYSIMCSKLNQVFNSLVY